MTDSNVISINAHVATKERLAAVEAQADRLEYTVLFRHSDAGLFFQIFGAGGESPDRVAEALEMAAERLRGGLVNHID